MDCRIRSVPKRGSTVAECEDAFACDLARGRFALADGATEGYPSGPWAKMLVDAFVRLEGGTTLPVPLVAHFSTSAERLMLTTFAKLSAPLASLPFWQTAFSRPHRPV